jgi:ATP-dependent Clp protease adaptor protein ClpS
MGYDTKKQEKPENEVDVLEEQSKYLILFNDDYNTFDFVIETLMEVCRHDYLQAEQCAYITHFNGKCDVKKGDYDTLKPMKDSLIDRGLSASIN